MAGHQAQVHPQSIDLGLERLRRGARAPRLAPPRVPVITVAGHQRQGLGGRLLRAAILAAAGWRVGTFTSPHLRDYRERIRIGECLVEREALLSAFERIERHVGPRRAGASRSADSLTFFEYNTLAALLIFEAAKLDAWVLEIGMGGRLDAVNVVDPDVAVVVSIGFDHQRIPRLTLEAIAPREGGHISPRPSGGARRPRTCRP